MSFMKTLIRFIISCAFCFILPAAAESPDRVLPLDKIKLPSGFSIEQWADVPNVRGLTLGKKGTVFAGSMSEGKVYAITETDGTRKVRTIANALTTPLGVAFQNGALYVSAVDRILRFDDIEDKLDQPGKPVVIFDNFPNEKHHGGKFIAFGPDGLLYVPVGAPCNICEPDPER
ncbi:MAG: sorbosone dehydrogenase family protein, partial [Nitrosospira sp.]